LSAPRIEIVERIPYTDFRGKPCLKVGYYVIDGDQRIPPMGTPAHIDVEQGQSVERALDQVLEAYKKYRPGKYP
jgi:hypothetical protein